LLAKIHMGKAALGMAEDDYRALLGRIAGAASAADLRVPQLAAVVEELKRLGWADKPKAPKRAGNRPQAGDPQSAKIRALWLALYHLGEIANPEEVSLAAFAKRQTGVDALQFLTVYQARKVTEVLKSWCARIGYQVPSDKPLLAKVLLVRAQWARLITAGAVDPGQSLGDWLSGIGLAVPVNLMSMAQLDHAAEALGKRVRAMRSNTK
jgi:phage gp16-like protein